ncbi:MAG: carbohydrate-binding domain-containing protein [Butyrivibrio sp.]|nr:carbohydrate-binding domain-containing protein [Butyrivibrio sp.]
MKKYVLRLSGILAAVPLALAMTACRSEKDTAVRESQTAVNDTNDTNTPDKSTYVTLDSKDTDTDFTESEACIITLNGTSAEFSGSGAAINGKRITVSAAGTYIIRGTLDDGQLIVNVKSGDVRLVFDNARISCSDSCPVFVANADKVIITLAEGSDNFLSDGSLYDTSDGVTAEANAVIYSKDDLTVNGSGSLKIDAAFNNGITCNDDLRLAGGKITVSAADNGIKCNDAICIADVELDISSEGDGIQAGQNILIEDGKISIVSGGGSANGKLHQDSSGRWDFSFGQNNSEDSESIKGIKSASEIRIDGGELILDCADDALHANGSIYINGGSFSLSSGDDAIHADSAVTVSDGTINIENSYEGIEAAKITVNGGQTTLTASDDGLNASGDGINGSASEIIINGGTLYINAKGDGIDSNGSITMNGGTAVVDGPTDNGNGAIDFGTAFYMNGGYLAAAGSSGMACNISQDSKQCGALIAINGASSNETVTLADSDGNVLISFTPSKSWNALNLSTPDMKLNETYYIYSGGTVTGSEQIGADCFIGGTVSGGTELTSFTQSSVAYSSGGMGGMGGFGGGHEGFGGQPGGKPDGNIPDDLPNVQPDSSLPDDFPNGQPDGGAPDGRPGGFVPRNDEGSI